MYTFLNEENLRDINNIVCGIGCGIIMIILTLKALNYKIELSPTWK